jgi:hypothetical protein
MFTILTTLMKIFFANGARISGTFRSLNQVARKYGKGRAGADSGDWLSYGFLAPARLVSSYLCSIESTCIIDRIAIFLVSIAGC